MIIDYDFRADITVCELIQYLNDELQNAARNTDEAFKYGTSNLNKFKVQMYLEKENRILDLIDSICMYANFADREV